LRLDDKTIPHAYLSATGIIFLAHSSDRLNIFNLSEVKTMTNKLLISALLDMATIALVQATTNAAELTGKNISAAQQFLSTGVTKYNSGDKQGALADYNQAI
jgi:hypothetical protein